MEKVYIYTDLPIGPIGIGEVNGALCHLVFSEQEKISEWATQEYEIEETPVIRKVKEQLDAYFRGESAFFDVPLMLNGTVFQKKVWAALAEIPYGETRTYKQISEKIGCPKGSRAVGLANNKNPISIIVPCHRVIGSNGKMVGYGGGIKIKEQLLALEKRIVENE